MISIMEQTDGNEEDEPPIKKQHYEIYSKPSECFGQVSKLSNYLNSDWWCNLFGETYLKTDGDVVENEYLTENEVANLIIIITNYGKTKNSKILDICCGQGRHLINLHKQGYNNLTGVDYSEYLLNIGKKRDNEIKFIRSDARNIPLNETFDIIQMMGNSYGYFTEFEDNIKILNEVNRLLETNGIFILEITNGTYMKNNYKKNTWEWLDKKTLVCRERELSDDNTKLISREIIIDLDKFKIIDQFYSEYLFDINSITKILNENNFIVQNIIPYNITSENHDEGMMGNRFLIICVKHI